MTKITAPDRSEAAEYYFTYIDKVGRGDIVQTLESQLPETLAVLRGITEPQSKFRYAEGKWSIRQVLSHINDGERLFCFRAFWFARGFDSALPSFEQDDAVAHSRADERSWASLVSEFAAVRAASLALFADLPNEAWSRRGLASGNPVTVRALAYITAGHVIHHMRVLHERYLPAMK